MKKCLSVLLFILTTILVENALAVHEFPTSVERCKAGDTNCLAKVINQIFRTRSSGIPDIGLMSLDPFLIGNTVISQSAQSSLNINITLTNAAVYGWRNLQVKKVNGFGKDPRNSKFEVITYVPYESMVGSYILNGQFLFLPISGNGMVNITFDKVEMTIKLYTKVETRDAGDYLKVKSVGVQVKCKSLNFNFTNLFNDKALSDNMNKFMNDNNELMYTELRPSIAHTFKNILNDYIPPVFERFPYRSFFIADDKE